MPGLFKGLEGDVRLGGVTSLRHREGLYHRAQASSEMGVDHGALLKTYRHTGI